MTLPLLAIQAMLEHSSNEAMSAAYTTQLSLARLPPQKLQPLRQLPSPLIAQEGMISQRMKSGSMGVS
jgi:hypothetical protein